MAIIQSLRDAQEDVHFYNIDYHRPSHEEVREYFRKNQFDLVGISAVVSTAYAYTKSLAQWIREVSPGTVIVIGGNLAASAEILLKKCPIDLCVIGDGERIICDVVNWCHDKPLASEKLKDIRGIAYLDDDGEFCFTGYAPPPGKAEVSWPDYDILEDDNSIDHFITDDQSIFYNIIDPEEIRGRKRATVISTKGCVARCTFCHRWERGYRAKPASQTVDHVRYLIDRYNVGFLDMSDENFGSDRQMTQDLVEHLGEMGVKWRAGGVRVRSVDLDTLKFWRQNGCVAVMYGIESGSPKMLKIMEKNASIEKNISALKATYEAGLFTIIQLVIGMPGEDDETIEETIDFLKAVAPYLILRGAAPSSLMSTNYAQALPGTPLYEYGREHGFIGQSIEEEEEYLYKISDIDAYSTDHFVNYTKQPLLKVLLWRPWITAAVDADYLQREYNLSLSIWQVVMFVFRRGLTWAGRKRGVVGMIARIPAVLFSDKNPVAGAVSADHRADYTESGYFNIKAANSVILFLNPLTKRLFYPLLAFAVAVRAAESKREAYTLIKEHVLWSAKRRIFPNFKVSYNNLPDIGFVA